MGERRFSYSRIVRPLTGLMLAAGLVTGLIHGPPAEQAHATTGQYDTAGWSTTETALNVLETLDIKAEGSRSGYSRSNFGSRWKDVDRNGCDTRNDILQRDLTNITTRDDGCVVLTGRLQDPFSGNHIDFVRGPSSDEVQIDHVVALSDAWRKGARFWSKTEREEFANDPLNLLAVDGPLNNRKGDKDASGWLPPLDSYHCPYVARQVAVKAKYDAWVTHAEHGAMEDVLSTCPDEPVP